MDATAHQSRHTADGARHEPDGDNHSWLKVDSQFANLINEGNTSDEEGNLVFKTAAQRWGETRERHLLLEGPPRLKREVPTFEQFATRFVDGHARANRQKPSGIAAVESIVKWHLRPALGPSRLDAITNEQVQRLKLAMTDRAPKTTNNVLTVLRVLLKKAVEWGELDKLPCSITLLPNPKQTMGFHDFADYERVWRRRRNGARTRT